MRDSVTKIYVLVQEKWNKRSDSSAWHHETIPVGTFIITSPMLWHSRYAQLVGVWVRTTMKSLQNFRTVQSPGHRENVVSAVTWDARRLCTCDERGAQFPMYSTLAYIRTIYKSINHEDSVSGSWNCSVKVFLRKSSILRYVQYNKEGPEHARNWNQIVKYNSARNALVLW